MQFERKTDRITVCKNLYFLQTKYGGEKRGKEWEGTDGFWLRTVFVKICKLYIHFVFYFPILLSPRSGGLSLNMFVNCTNCFIRRQLSLNEPYCIQNTIRG